MKLVSACILSFLLFFYSTASTVLAAHQYYFPEASEGQINEAILKIVPVRWLPSNPFYFLISAKETVSRLFMPSSAKRADFDFVLSGKRLKETYLLLEKGDARNANKTLERYASRLNTMDGQLEKARSQNQDIAAIVAGMAEGFKYQEILLFAIWQKTEGPALDVAQSAFVKSIDEINNIIPGVKDRFKTVASAEMVESSSSARPSPPPDRDNIPQATSSVRPRRIIY